MKYFFIAVIGNVQKVRRGQKGDTFPDRTPYLNMNNPRIGKFL